MGWFVVKDEAFGEVCLGGVVLKDSKRYRLSGEELELVVTGLLLLANDRNTGDRVCDVAVGLAERLCQCRAGRPGGFLNGDAVRLWRKAERRSDSKRW
jgi:hypothetical protein